MAASAHARVWPVLSSGGPCSACQRAARLYRKFSTTRCAPSQQVRPWVGVVGLEVHAQIATHSKLFSGAGTKFAAPVNTQVSFFDAALPGTLPVLNRGCVEAGIKTAMALNSCINKVSKFDRKHYFYADLPAGYQITQQRQPIAVGGQVEFVVFNPAVHRMPYSKTVHLVQLQLEQDSGKSLHDDLERHSLIDLNRAGVGLMEIVTKPDLSDGEEAAAFVKELQMILQTLGTCDGKMEEGSLRVDANISVHRPGDPLGKRAEVKNLNSIRSVAKAISYEIQRQIAELERGGEVVEETRSFDSETGQTIPMRDKEKQLDYRFMPEPNLPPLHVYERASLPTGVKEEEVVLIDKLRDELPVLPSQYRQLLQENYGLPLLAAINIVNKEGLLEFFRDVASSASSSPTHIAHFLLKEYLAVLNDREISLSQSAIPSRAMAELIDLVGSEFVTLASAHRVMQHLLEHPEASPRAVVEDNDWTQITDQDTLVAACQKAMEDNPKAVAKYRRGKGRSFNTLMGQIQKDLDRRANQKTVADILRSLLEK